MKKQSSRKTEGLTKEQEKEFSNKQGKEIQV